VRLLGSEREQLVQVTLEFDGGPFVGFIAVAEKRPQLKAIVAGLETARALPERRHLTPIQAPEG
jgi:hypothetical protein